MLDVRRLLLATLTSLVCASAATPSASADDWAVKRKGTGLVFAQRYKRILEGRPEMGFIFKRLVQLYAPKGGADALADEYKARADKDPANWKLRVLYGHFLRHTGKHEDAVKAYTAAMTAAKDEFLPAFALAEVLTVMRQSDAAQKAYDAALLLARRDDHKRDCLTKLAALALREGKVDKAKERFKQLLTVGPKDLQAREDLAALLARYGLHQEALTEYEAILGKIRLDNLKVSLTLREIGALRDKLGKHEDAIKAYRRALKLLSKTHWLRRELSERIVDVHRRRGSLAELAVELGKRGGKRDPEALFTLAKLEEELGREDAAIKTLRRALKVRPGSSEARLKLIDLLEGQQRADEAMAEYAALVKRDGGDPEHRLRLARAYLRRGDRDGAAKALKAAEKKFGKSVPVLRNVADLYGKHGLAADARRVYERLVVLDPRDPELRKQLGDILLAQGKLADAETNWSKIVEQDATSSQGYVRLAQIYLGHNLVDKAIEALEKAVAADGKNVEARIELGKALGKAGRAEDALKVWKEAWRLAADAQHLRTAEQQLVALWDQLGQLAETASELAEAFEKDKKDLRTGRLLAAIWVKTKNLLGAERTLRDVLKEAPDDVEALLALEKLYAARGDLAQARDAVVRAAKLDKRRAKRHYRRAIEYTLKTESPKEAAALARRLVDLNPVDGEAHAQLAELYEKSGRDADALQVFARAIQLSPQEFKYQMSLAALQHKLGKAKDAFASYRAIIAGSTDEAVVVDATKRLIVLGREQGRIGEVERELKLLSAANPKSMAHYQALAELYRALSRTADVDAVLERASRRTTDRSGALALLAAQAREKGDVRRAISYMRRQILEASKPSASQYRALAELYFELGDGAKGRTVIEEMIRTVGDKARAWQTAAALYQKYQFPEEALAALAKQVEHNPADLATKLKLARSYVDADRLREAEALLKDIVDSAIGVGPSLGRRARAPAPAPTTPVAMRVRRRMARMGVQPTPPASQPAPVATGGGTASELRREALSLLVGIYERWGSADVLTAKLERGLGDKRQARRLLSDLVAIYRLRGQVDKVAELLGKGVAMFPREVAWHALLAEVESERGRFDDAQKLYLRLEREVDPANARRYAEKRVQLYLDRDKEKEALAAVEAFAKGHRRPVGFLSRVADLLAGRGSFKMAITLLERAGREDNAARTLVRDKLVEYLIASGKRAEAATVLAEALDEEARAPIANPTGVYGQRDAKLRRYFDLLDRIAREKFALKRSEDAKAEPQNLLLQIDLHLCGMMLGNEPLAREPLASMLRLGYRDKQLVSVALERIILAGDFGPLAPVLDQLFATLGETAERKRIAEVAIGHLRTHRRVPPAAMAELLVGAQLGQNPTTPDYRAVGELYAVWGNFAKAVDYYEAARKRSPGDADLYRELGRIYQQMGRAEDAKKLFRDAIARGVMAPAGIAPMGSDPLDRAMHRTREMLVYYRAAGEVEAYERKLQEDADKTPDDAQAQYELAALLQNLGHRGRALAIVERLVKARPQDAEVLEVLGRLYKERGDYRTAAKLYEDALKLGSFRKRNLYRDLIFAYRRIGEEKKAFELEKRMAWEMGDEFALYRLALELQKNSQTAESIKAYKRYLSLKYSRFAHLSGRRRTLRVALELAKFLLRAGRAAEAAQELEAFLPMVRGIPVASFERRNFIQRLTALYQQQGVLNDKLARWEEKSKTDPFFLDVLYHFHESRGNAAEKLRLLERTVAMRPRDETRVEALAEEYARRGKYDDAIKALMRLDGVASTPNYLLRVGNLYHYKGRRDLALQHWRKHVEALFTYPTYRDFRSRRLFALAEILDREGYRTEAERARIDAVEAAAVVDAYQYGRIIGEYVRRASYESAITITMKALEKVSDPQQRRNLLYALLPYGYYAIKHLAGLRAAVEARNVFAGAEKDGDPRAELAHLFYDILGERYRSAGNEGKAAEAFESALGYKDDADTQRNLIAIYKRLNKEGDVARIYERLIARKPNHSPYLRAAAAAYMKLKDWDKARPLLERDAKVAPSVESLLKLYELHKARGQLALAEEPLVRARKLAPGSMDVMERLEETYRAAADPQKLDAFYEEVARGVPVGANDLARLAALIERGGKIFGAVQVYKNAYLSTPAGSWQRRQAQDKLTQTLLRLGHPDLADEEVLRELPQAWQRYTVHERLAELLAQHNMQDKALSQLKRATFLAPQLPSLWHKAVSLARGLGMHGESKNLLQWGRSIHPKDAGLAKLASEVAPASATQVAMRRVLWRRNLGTCAVTPAIVGDVAITVECPRATNGSAAASGQRAVAAKGATAPVRFVGRGLRDGARRWTFALPKLQAPLTRDGATASWRYRVMDVASHGGVIVAAVNEDQFESAPGIGTGRVRRLHLVSLRASDGHALWHEVVSGDYAGGPIAIANNAVYVQGQNLRAYALGSGKPLWHAYAGSNAYGWIFDQQNASRAAALPGLVFSAGKDGKLYAMDAATGAARWTFAAPTPIHASPLADGDAVFFLADDGWFYAVGAEDGRLRWRRFVGGDVREETHSYGHGYYTRPRQRGRPAADQARVYVTTGAGLVVALSRADGKVAWRRKLADHTARDLSLSSGKLLVAGERRALYALSPEQGEIVWQYARGSAAPLDANGGVAVAVLGDTEGEGAEHRAVSFDLASDSLLRERAQALGALAATLERNRDTAMLDALLRNVASPIDADFRALHERLMSLRAEAGDTTGVLESAGRLIALRDGDDSWLSTLRSALERSFARAPARKLPARPANLSRLGPPIAPVAAPTLDFASALRAHLDAMPVDERARGLAGELLLLRGATSLAERLIGLGRVRALKARAAAPFLHALTEAGEADLRSLAAVALAELDDYTAKDALREALRARQVGRRRAAVQAIAKSLAPDDLDALRAAVSDSDVPVRTEAALALSHHAQAHSERHGGAMEVLRLALTSGDDEVKIKAALALARMGDRAGVSSLKNLTRVRRGPLQAQAADALFELGDRAALPILLDHRTRDGTGPTLTTVRLVVGNIFMLLEDDRGALLEYRSILSFDPELDKAWANIGALYLARGRAKDALPMLDRALAQNPFLASALAARALARARTGDLKGASADVSDALAKDPTSRAAAISQVEVLVRSGDLEGAQTAMTRLLARFKRDPEAHIAMVRLRLGEAGERFKALEHALTLAQAAVTLSAERMDAHLALAEVLQASGRLDEALAAGRRALGLAIGAPMRKRAFDIVERLRAKREAASAPQPPPRT